MLVPVMASIDVGATLVLSLSVSSPVGDARSKPMRPLRYTKSESTMVTSPSARSSSPWLPAKSMVVAPPTPVATSKACAPEKSMTWSPSRAAWLSWTSTLRTLRPRSPRPTRPTLVALAVSAVHLRAVSVCDENIARPKSTSCSSRPRASPVPPLAPTKTSISEPPMVSTSTATSSALEAPAFLASVTKSLEDVMAKLPSTCTKPKTSSFRWPLACSSSPLEPSRLRTKLLFTPVTTRSAVAPAP